MTASAARAQQPASQPASAESKDRELERLWDRTGGADYPAAYIAVYRLAVLGDPACEMLRGKVPPFQEILSKADKAQVERLIGDLDADQFEVRSRANKELALLGAWALPHLRLALRKTTSEEVRARLTDLISGMEDPSKGPPERRQLARAARTLRWIDTAPARDLLKTIRSWPAGPAEDEIEETAWGPVIDGLQAGLRYEFGHRPYRQGKVVPLVLVVRNSGAKTVTLSLPRVPQFINWNNYSKPPTPQILDAQGAPVGPDSRLSGIGIAGDPIQQAIASAQMITVGRVPLPIWLPGSPGAMMVNVLAFMPKPGSHSVSVAWTFETVKEGDWKGSLTTAPLGLDVVAPDTWVPSLPEEPALGWGEVGGGIQCRALLASTVLEADQPPWCRST